MSHKKAQKAQNVFSEFLTAFHGFTFVLFVPSCG